VTDIILGRGQAGKAVFDNYLEPPQVYDKGEWEDLDKVIVDMLHICIPFNDDFFGVIGKALYVFRCKILVIHSTVKPGTTRKIEHPNKVYSPIMGRHKDDFSKNIRAYNKILSGNEDDCHEVMGRFNLGMDYWGDNWDELEFAKVMSTAYMFWNLIYNKVIHKECNERGYDPKRVYNEWQRNYNTGISGTHADWKRPIYHYDESPIPGGHCLVPNLDLDNNLITSILKDWVQSKGTMKYDGFV